MAEKKKRKKGLSAYEQADGSFDILSMVRDENDGLSNQIINTLDRIEGKTRGCSTGLLTLDFLLNGALPAQKMNYYFGPNQSGKSTNMYFAVKEAQRQGRIVIFVDAEMSIEWDYLTKLGIDPHSKTTVFLRPLVGEDAMMILKRVLKKFADANYYFPDDKTPLIIFDSLAALVPDGVYEEKESRAMLARLLSDNLKALNALVQFINGTIIAVNQIRSSAGVMFAPLINEPGGWAVKFYPSTKIKIKAKDPFEYPDGVKGHYAEFTLTKTRHCPYFPPQLLALRTGEGFNQMDDLLKMMDASGFLSRPTNFSYEFNDALFRRYLPTYKLPSKIKMKNADMNQYLYDNFEPLYLGMREVITEGSIFGQRTDEQDSLLKRLEKAEQEQILLAEELAKSNDLPSLTEGMALMDSQGPGALGKELQRMETGDFKSVSANIQYTKQEDPEPTVPTPPKNAPQPPVEEKKPAPKPAAKKKATKKAPAKKAAAPKPKPAPKPAPKVEPPPKVEPVTSDVSVYSNNLTDVDDFDDVEF